MNFLSFFKKPEIEFLCEPHLEGVIPEPVPAGKKMPEWFKKVSPKLMQNARDDFGVKSMTAKHCLPLVDGMNTGFVISLAGDVNIRVNKDKKLIEGSKNPLLGDLITFHSLDQLGGKTSPTYPGPAIKFTNPWMIKTPKGISCLILPCLNTDEKRFTCLSAVVDTDSYNNFINFPAIWNVPDYDGVIEAGTPLVTVIPFKRSDMPKNASVRSMNIDELEKLDTTRKIQSARSHYYTRELREKR